MKIKFTPLEQEQIRLICGMIVQHCSVDGINYHSAWLSANESCFEHLIDLGIMEGNNLSARFIVPPDKIYFDDEGRLVKNENKRTPIKYENHCEWNPDEDREFKEGDKMHGKTRWVVGSKSEWHLCDSCVNLNRFKNYKIREIGK